MPLRRLLQQVLSVQRTLPGRLFLLSGALLVVMTAAQMLGTLPDFLDLFRKVAKLAFMVSVGWLVIKSFARSRRQWLWAVRTKLILSYVFFGVFPVALVVVFTLVGGLLVYMSVAGYLFHVGYQSVVEDVSRAAETAVAEISQRPEAADEVLARKIANLHDIYPSLSMASYRHGDRGAMDIHTAGPWKHLPRPDGLPKWLSDRAQPFGGSLFLTEERDAGDARDGELVVRAAVPSSDGTVFVLADVPADADTIAHIHSITGTHLDGATLSPVTAAGQALPIVTASNGARGQGAAASVGQRSLFRRTVVEMDFVDWDTGLPGRVAVSVFAPVWQLYDQITTLGGSPLSTAQLWGLLAMVAFLFVVIQASAFVGGVALARRITSAVHSLFVGTARIGQGDFTHRIPIGSNDQLGDLAGSFNNMSASIEHLRHVEREKLRLDEELQIARKIQRSLLPPATPVFAGLCISDLCEPALEVGGDYYDFFPLGANRLGLLVADVSGKGTSAALYMAELKGLVLALSRTHASPRSLLIELNELLADHLDNRSFITMTYAVIDLDARTLTCARAGHTPLLFCSNGRSESILPDGMVLGLRLPGASERFNALLKEHSQALTAGDVIVLYTDGITEAMDSAGELFGEPALARVVVASAELDSAGVRERILREVRAFVGDAEPHDDMTMVVVKVLA